MLDTPRARYLRRRSANRWRVLAGEEQWPKVPYASPTERVAVPYLRSVPVDVPDVRR